MSWWRRSGGAETERELERLVATLRARLEHQGTTERRGLSVQLVSCEARAGTSSLCRALALAGVQRLGFSVALVASSRHGPTKSLAMAWDEADLWTLLESAEALPRRALVVFDMARPQSIVDAIPQLRQRVELVLVDSPAADQAGDALLLARHLDGSILVVDAGRTDAEHARRQRESLEAAGGQVLGLLHNKRRRRAPLWPPWG
jgi:hypothetical protein